LKKSGIHAGWDSKGKGRKKEGEIARVSLPKNARSANKKNEGKAGRIFKPKMGGGRSSKHLEHHKKKNHKFLPGGHRTKSGGKKQKKNSKKTTKTTKRNCAIRTLRVGGGDPEKTVTEKFGGGELNQK